MAKKLNTYGFEVTKRYNARYISQDETYEVYVKASTIYEAEDKARKVGEVGNQAHYTYAIKLVDIDEAGI